MTESTDHAHQIDPKAFREMCESGDKTELMKRLYLEFADKAVIWLRSSFRASLDMALATDAITDKIVQFADECSKVNIRTSVPGTLRMAVVNQYRDVMRRERRYTHPNDDKFDEDGVSENVFDDLMTPKEQRVYLPTPDSEMDAKELARCIDQNFNQFVTTVHPAQLDLIDALWAFLDEAGALSNDELYETYVAGFQATRRQKEPRAQRGFEVGIYELKKRFGEKVLVKCGVAHCDVFRTRSDKNDS